MKHHLLLPALSAAIVAWSCSPGGPPLPGPTAPSASASPTPAAPATAAFAYVAHGDSHRGGIAAYRVDLGTGALDPVMNAPLEYAAGLAADPSGRFLYTVDNGSGGFPLRPSERPLPVRRQLLRARDLCDRSGERRAPRHGLRRPSRQRRDGYRDRGRALSFSPPVAPTRSPRGNPVRLGRLLRKRFGSGDSRGLQSRPAPG